MSIKENSTMNISVATIRIAHPETFLDFIHVPQYCESTRSKHHNYAPMKDIRLQVNRDDGSGLVVPRSLMMLTLSPRPAGLYKLAAGIVVFILLFYSAIFFHL